MTRSTSATICALLAAAASAADDSFRLKDGRVFDAAEFAARAKPLTRCFIFERYAQFAASELTFRHLKTHLKDQLGMAYEDLKRDEVSNIVEDVTDQIANECEMGSVDIARCKRLIGHNDATCGVDWATVALADVPEELVMGDRQKDET